MAFLINHFLVFSIVAIEIFCEKLDNKEQIKCDNKTSGKFEGFIVGGEETVIDRFPHAVCLFHYPLHIFYCGSSVLNQRVLLTAAHCVEEEEGKFSLEAYAGHENLEKAIIRRKVTRIVKHELYDIDTTQHDIAILFLDDRELPLGGSSPLKRVIISKNFPLDTKIAEISGWGNVDDVTRESSTVLKSTKQNIIPLEECQERDFLEWMPGMMCAGDANSDTNRPARGDSGGGLITPEFQQIGVVSYTLAEEPGLIVYTNISYYYDWIVNLVEDNICGNN